MILYVFYNIIPPLFSKDGHNWANNKCFCAFQRIQVVLTLPTQYIFYAT